MLVNKRFWYGLGCSASKIAVGITRDCCFRIGTCKGWKKFKPHPQTRIWIPISSLLAEVSHDVNDGRETSAGFRRVVWWGRRPNFWSKLTGFQNRFRLMCYARASLDWTLTIIEPTVDNSFCEFRNFSIPAIKSSVSTLGDKRIKEITSLERKSILGFLKGRNKCVSPDGLRQIFNLPPQQYEWPPSYLLFTVTRISSLQNLWRGWWVSLRVSLVRIVMIES